MMDMFQSKVKQQLTFLMVFFNRVSSSSGFRTSLTDKLQSKFNFGKTASLKMVDTFNSTAKQQLTYSVVLSLVAL